ncbi:TNC [Symbiodinium microadriaticum]|nr:TNC [Symbiodinium microadriaticum]
MRDPALLAWAFAVHAAAIQEHDAALDMGSHIHPEVQGGVMAASVFESLNGCELWSVLGVVVADLMLRRFYVRLMVEGSGMVQLCRQHLLLGLQVAASEEEPLAFPFHTKCSGARRLPALELGCPRFFLGGGNGMKIGLVVAFVQVMPTLIKDFFSDLNDLLRKLSLETGAQVSSTGCLMTLDLVWFLVAAMIALALACWQPAEIVGDTSEVGSDGVKWTPPPWYALTTIFASLSSHAAGILGFVGFQKIVVARIVSTSQPRANWSAPNFLLLTSIAISITAIFSSLVFMGVDYLRRLAIDSAWSRGYRLVVMRGRLERTGLGMALIMLTLVLIVLYMLVIYTETETQNSKKQEASSESAASTSRDMQVFLDKVQFHQIIAGAGEDLGEISIEDYFKKFCDGRDETWSSIRSGLARAANCLAGEDLGLFVKMGTRRALFPNQRLAPLLNVGIVMLFGMLPGVFQFATEKLFVDPQILAVSIEICCETDPDNCAHYTLEHSLIEFDEKPAILEIPAASSTRCSLTARGLSKKSSTTLDLMVAVKSVKNVCDCHQNICSCCNGYQGGLDAEEQEVQKLLATDFCTPVRCAIQNSNRRPGPLCNCRNGYAGNIVWEGAQVSGQCTPAPCYIEYSTRKPGPDCKCMDGYYGNISWNRSQPLGSCVSAGGCADNVENSVGEGTQCTCKDGFTGKVLWRGAVLQGSCKAAECRIENSNQQPGPGCKCKDGYVGDITWHGDHPSGTCTPAPCTIKNSNREPGQQCACLDGFAGEIAWKNHTPQGLCKPASCANIANSTGLGTQCRCSDGFQGTVTWSGANASGSCTPARCTVPNSDKKRGPACKCLEGCGGIVRWEGNVSYGLCSPLRCRGTHSNGKTGLECGCEDGFEINGSRELVVLRTRFYNQTAFAVKCIPAPCSLEHSNRQPGKECRCADGYYGDVTWKAQVPSGNCKPAPCYVPTSNRKPGPECKCLDAFSGQITWMGERPKGRCRPAQCNISNSNREPGNDCKCQDGFVGKIVWKDDVPHGSCRPAPCNIQNSNLEPGPGCRCEDGFGGYIAWDGPSATGACEPMPCHVLHSDHAPGPACRCLSGFFGRIVWRGPTVSGTCAPRPLCGSEQEEALHVTRLVADLTDDSYNTCRAGQAMLVHGHTYGNLRLRWTFAEALPPAKCKVEWPDSHIEVNNPDPEHFSLTSWCSAMPGQPFCWSPIVYTVTTRNTSQFACDSCKTSEHALTEFRGSRCGYDLIKWESLTINPGSPNACECNLSLSCSELPSEELPRACIHFAEPAILSKDDGDYLVFYETGEVSQAITSADDVDQADELGAVSANWRWLCDGENLFVVKAGDIDIWSGDAGSFYSKDYSATLQPRAVLPAWWEVKFQHLALPGSFNTDTLLGCELSFQSGTMCYHTLFGSSVRVAPAQGDCAFQNFTAADSHVLYEYKSSAFGVQTYRSSKTCYPKAAFEEIRVQMEDVVLPADRFETEVGSDAAGRNPEGRTSIDTMCKMSLPSFATPRSGMVQLCRQHLLLGLHVVLGVCLHLSLAARASSWEATTLYLDEPQQSRPKPDSDSETWGDFFSDFNDLLRTLDLVWFLVAATIALALACWQPAEIVGDTSEVGSDGVKWAPPPWYALTTIFASLSSHAAGILGFVGFQKIVVARIVSTSQPRANWSAPNFLLLTSIAISITAIFSSLVFMGVDYLRRLAIDSAWSRGYRLVVMRGRLERTGLGMALIMLTLVLIVLYMLVIYMETQNSKKQEDSSESAASTSRDMQIFLDKVQFHRIIAGAGEDLGEISIEDYFKKFCDGRDERSSIRSGLAGVANRLAGEDLGLFVKMGTRRALFPNQRLAPLLNVGIVMLFGMLPGVFQFATEKLFVDPQILAVRPISADLLPAFDSENMRSKYVLLLGRDPRLHVKTKSAQTSSIEICCETDPGNCTRYALEHSLIQFDEKPAILEIPAESSTRCSLTARGLSKKSSTTLDLMVAVKAIKNVCDCHKNICSCCNGYQGELDADGEEVQKLLATDFCTPVPCGIDNSNRKPGPECNCSNGYVGDIVWEGTNVSGNCTPAPCYVEDSNRKPGLECQCRDGFGGEVRWEGSEASGKCLPATCNILYSTGTGKGCRCQDGYQGDIKWNGDRVTGHCTPAACDIENSTKEPGLQCQCRDGFAGKVHWKGSEAFGECLPADCSIPYSTGMGADCRCMDGYAGSINWNHRSQPQGKCVPAVGCADNVENSVGEGPQCKCKDGFTGKVLWQGAVPHGSCKAAECHIKNANQQPGPGCKCKDGYVGDISWHGDRPSGTCTPAPCPIKNSNREPGPQCACLDGFAGEIAWKGQVPSGYCSAAPCVSIEHSNGKPGLECKCKDGFTGSIRWHASVPQGSCQAAECYIANANQQPGPGCECKDGYVGEITWHGDRPSGTCTPAPCMIENSNARTAFLELLRGEVMSPMDDAGKDVVGLYIFYETGDLLLTPSAELSRADDSEEADRLGAESADHTWLSDGENVLSIGPHNTEIWLGSTAGSHFVYNGSVLWARTALPEWWKVKFKQEAALPGSFNTDKLAGCEFAFKSGNLCYSARLGQSVWVAPAHGDCRFQDITNADKSIAHKYRSSAFGIQTYRSNVTCYPTAAFEEILVQVVDVGMPAEDFNYTVASSPCRTTIRYMTDARSKLSECSFFR